MEVNWLVVWPSPFHFNYQQLFDESKEVNKFIGSIEHYMGIDWHTLTKTIMTDNRNKRKIPLCRKTPKPIRLSLSHSFPSPSSEFIFYHFMCVFCCCPFVFKLHGLNAKNIVINQFNDSMILRGKNMPQLFACLCVAFVYVCVYLF